MPAQTPELEMMDEDRLIEEVLDKFVNCHEQTYEEFLRMFTHLSQDNVTKRPRLSQVQAGSDVIPSGNAGMHCPYLSSWFTAALRRNQGGGIPG